jgi:hypothetical protein
MIFWFEFLDIYMNEKQITCHDCHGFKWQDINIYPILIIFLCSPMPLFVRWIVTIPLKVLDGHGSHVKLEAIK